MIEINLEELRDQLIKIYSSYIENNVQIKDAKEIFLKYSGAKDYLPEHITDAVMTLETIGWDLKPKLSKIKAKKLLEKLHN